MAGKSKDTKSFNINSAREFVRKKQLQKARNRKKLFEKAKREFDAVVRLITKNYSVNRIYQWGSLLNQKHFSEISDIDIALEGVKSQKQFFSMFGEAKKLCTFPLDMVQIEKINQIHARNIKNRGRLVYEKK